MQMYNFCFKVKFLQETVQKEVEERFELTEALSTARTELLKLKKPSGIILGQFLTRVAIKLL
jgi:hypothetical protein